MKTAKHHESPTIHGVFVSENLTTTQLQFTLAPYQSFFQADIIILIFMPEICECKGGGKMNTAAAQANHTGGCRNALVTNFAHKKGGANAPPLSSINYFMIFSQNLISIAAA